MAKSSIKTVNDLNAVGFSYYAFCMEQALANIKQARALVKGDVIEANHELPKIEQLIAEAIDAI